ncbi:MAG: HdeD family acid-resistance protein [Polyangia bacterium]
MSLAISNLLSPGWRALALRGALSIVFGVLALIWPGLTLATLVLLFGAYSLADGAFAIVAALRRHARSWPLVVEGAVGIAAGLGAFLWPGLTALALVYLIAAWAVVTGALEIAAAVRLRRVIQGEWLLALSGVASIALGLLLMARPGLGALALVGLLAAYAIVFGGLLLGLALRLRARIRAADASLSPHPVRGELPRRRTVHWPEEPSGTAAGPEPQPMAP